MPNSSSKNLILAFFNDHSDAANAVRDLRTAGFRSDQIGTSYEDYDVDDRDVSAGSTTAGGDDNRSFWQKIENFFSGDDRDRKDTDTSDRGSEWSAGGLAIPGHYRDRLSRGGELVSVRSADRRSEAEQILTRNNGQIDNDSASYTEHPATAPGMGQGTRADITGGSTTPGLQSSQTRTGAATTGNNAMNTGARGALGDIDERRIQLISEVLRVRKERVARGEVRLRKEVRTETQNVQVPVTREEIVIERNPVQGERTATGQIGTDSEIRVPLSEERVEVDKVPVVTEEVRVAKRPVSETQNVRDQVRREELEVEGADEKVRGDVNKRKTA
jgi:uncharacterized protein (TIGR02271 family)